MDCRITREGCALVHPSLLLIGGSQIMCCFLADRLSPLAWLFSRRLRRLRREECSKLHYPAEKYRLFGVVAVIAVLWFVCVNQRETFGASSGYIDWVLFRVILPQITQMTQRNAASCIISQRKTGCLRLKLFCCFVVLGFVCVNQWDLRETFGASSVRIDWVLLRVILP